MPNPLTIADASDLVDKAIQSIWIKGSVKQPFYSQYFNTTTGVTDYYMKDSSISGLGYATRVVENAVVTAESPVQGFDQTLMSIGL